MRIGVRINAGAVARRLEQLRAAAEPASAPMRQALNDSMDVYMDGQRARFAAASGGDGTWAPLAESTVRQRERRGDTPVEALHITGGLEGSLERGSSDHVFEETPDGVREATSHCLAVIHHNGSTSRHLPARPVMAEPEDESLDEMKEKLVAGMRQSIVDSRGT